MAEKNSVIYALGGEIDHHQAVRIRNELDNIIMEERPELLIFDFSNVKFMDSSGIGLVLGRNRLIEALGGKVEIIGASKNIELIFKMSGVDRIIKIK